jgi:hypothetical protein
VNADDPAGGPRVDELEEAGGDALPSKGWIGGAPRIGGLEALLQSILARLRVVQQTQTSWASPAEADWACLGLPGWASPA